MTFLEVINAVLRRIREDSVTASNATDYSKLIADFVNQAIYDTEHAFDWNSLKETIDITTVAAQEDYAFSETPVHILAAINDTKNWYMKVITDHRQFSNRYLDSGATGSPYHYSFIGKNGDSSQINLYPVPDGVETLRFLCKQHTAEYAIDASDDSEVLKIPTMPVILNAYARAVSERGEDGGIGVNEANREAASALADAISLDSGVNHPCELAWNVH